MDTNLKTKKMKTKLRLMAEKYHPAISEAAKLLMYSTAHEVFSLVGESECAGIIRAHLTDSYLVELYDENGTLVCAIEEIEVYELAPEEDVFGGIFNSLGKALE